jgi:SMODS-associating 4TM effector domain
MIEAPPMNQIPVLQNADAQLRLLRARRQTYTDAKHLLILQLCLAIGVPVVGAFCALIWPSLRGLVALASIVITVLDVTLIDRLQKTLLKRAAILQEQFDCAVLELPWDKFTVGSKIDPETIHGASSQYRDGQEDAQLRNWYPAVVGTVPLHLARIICQRTNLWYDAKLRRQYGGFILGITISLTLLLVLFGWIGGLTIDTFVLTVLAPAAPIVIWGVREYLRQRDVAEALDRVRSEAEALWERAKAGTCSDSECTAQSRQFQNAIYERRSTSPLIFDWIYKVQRPRLEDQMNRGAEEFVREVSPNRQ